MKAMMIAGALMLVTAGAAQAACTQSDGVGKWRLFPGFVDASGLDWFRCTLVLDSTGKVGTKSSCVASTGLTLKADSGAVTIARNCSFNGSFSSSGLVVTLTDGQLSKDRQAMTGVGSGPLGLFVFTALKE